MKLAIITLLLITSTAWCQAQDNKTSKQQQKPDFSGTWQLDQSRSNNTPLIATISWTITHREPEIRILQKIKLRGEETTREFKYYTDANGEVNPLQAQYQVLYEGVESRDYPLTRIQSKTKWDGKKLKTRYSVLVLNQPRKLDSINVEEVWEMLADGKTIIHTTSFSIDNKKISIQPQKIKQVFTKIS
ncbi:MAG TPA: hypothetical protein VGO68_04015 [Pyrinomonadaceae bacterium]|jgi:hypothetical protein|nr:hypothetical protein [Pyrinomonadaceae bacterium]